MQQRSTRLSAIGGHRRHPGLTKLAQAILAAYRAAGAVIVQQDVHDQWDYQQRMLALYPGDADKCVLFQDRLGVTPLSTLGQMIGLRLDLETAGSFGVEKRATFTAGDAGTIITDVAGLVTLTNNDTTPAYSAANAPLVVGKTYRLTFEIVSRPATTPLRVLAGGSLDTGNTLEVGVHRYIFTAANTNGLVLSNGVNVTLAQASTWRGISLQEIPGCHMVATTDAKRPTLVAGSEAGSVTLDYNGTTHAMQSSAALNLTATDEVTIAIPLLKENPSATATVAIEFSPVVSSDGAFALFAPGGSVSSIVRAYLAGSRGNVSTALPASLNNTPEAPHKAVLSGVFKIGSDIALLRVNNVQIASSASDQGGGNYGNHVVYEGARAGTSLYFNGQLGGFTLIGKVLTDAQISVIERKINQRWKAF